MTQENIKQINNGFKTIGSALPLFFDLTKNWLEDPSLENRKKLRDVHKNSFEEFRNTITELKKQPVITIDKYDFDFTKFLEFSEDFFDKLSKFPQEMGIEFDKPIELKLEVNNAIEKLDTEFKKITKEIGSIKNRMLLAKIQSPLISAMDEMNDTVKKTFVTIKNGFNSIKTIFKFKNKVQKENNNTPSKEFEKKWKGVMNELGQKLSTKPNSPPIKIDTEKPKIEKRRVDKKSRSI